MDQTALKKAQRRLSVAQDAVAGLPKTEDFDAFSKNWYIFLHAAKGIYITLEQGSKNSPQSRQWFGAKNQERKSDPLLRYISEARNDDEHGIEEPVGMTPSVRTVGVPIPGASTMFTDENDNLYIRTAPYQIVDGVPRGFLPGYIPKRLISLDGKPVGSVYSPERIVLKRVKDRSGKFYRPPLEHLGRKLQSTAPRDVAKLTLDYLGELLKEAEGLSTP